jgi:putative thioredoxin
MNKEPLVFEVSEHSFAKSVLLNSHQVPVLVEFMGVWSEPCVLMGDLLSQLANEFPGDFIFAKVDIDENKALMKEYAIDNVPTLLVFQKGEMVRKEVGQLQETEARILLKDFGVYRESDLMREQAREQHLAGDTNSAILLLTEAIQKDPQNTRIALDMTQIFIDIGEIEQADALYNKLPKSTQDSEMGKSINGQLTFKLLANKTIGMTALEQNLRSNPDDFSARFDMAICLIADYQYEQAVQHLFHILDNEPEFREGAAREMVIAISKMIAPVNHDMAQAFRRELANRMSD